MSEIRLLIDGMEAVVEEGATVLDAARSVGVVIPTLCHHDELEPHGGCRLCIVEAEARGVTRLVASCVHPAEEGVHIRTRTEKLAHIRKNLVELLMAHAPEAPVLLELGRELGANRERFEKAASFCIHCGLCVRYCDEVKGLHAVGFIERGPKKEICFVPEIASRHCRACMECFPLCPTSYLQAAFVLTEALISPRGNR